MHDHSTQTILHRMSTEANRHPLCEADLNNSASLRKDLGKAVLAALAVTAALLFINWNRVPLVSLLPALLFCWLMHVVFFTVGACTMSSWIRVRMAGHAWRFLMVPLLLVIIFYGYIFVVFGSPFHWPQMKPGLALTYLAVFPLAAILPVLLFLRNAMGEAKPARGRDFLLFAVAAGVAGGFRFGFDKIPAGGLSFESGSRLVLLLVLVYATVVVRRLENVGFNLSFSWKDLLLTIGCWLVMLVLFMGMLYPAGLIEYVGYKDFSLYGFQSGTRYFLFHLFGVAAFEELVFRGVFQNMLAQKAERLTDQTRRRLWTGSVTVAAVAAFAVSFLIADARFRWLTPLVVVLIFVAAWLIEKRFIVRKGEYLVLAIISAVFGIVHFRFGVVFMALACLAGWFDGFVYTKTKNVLLAALIHALLNCSAMFLGMQKNF